MKRLITRIRNADRRRLAMYLVLVAIFVPLNWAVMKLTGLLVDSGPADNVIDAANSGYVIGFVFAGVFADMVRRAGGFLKARFARPVQANAAASNATT